MIVAVVDCGSGNLASVTRALAHAADAAGVSASIHLTSDPDLVAGCDRLVLPGQGAFAACMAGLAAVDGLIEAIVAADAGGAPFLGICVGMQIMARRGLEHGTTAGLGWIEGEVAGLEAGEGATELRLPHMGWNELRFAPGAHPLLDGLEDGAHAYFVHGYGLRGADPGQVIATVDYGGPVVAMVASGHRAGTQFHAEKSQLVGLRLLENFLRWTP